MPSGSKGTKVNTTTKTKTTTKQNEKTGVETKNTNTAKTNTVETKQNVTATPTIVKNYNTVYSSSSDNWFPWLWFWSSNNNHSNCRSGCGEDHTVAQKSSSEIKEETKQVTNLPVQNEDEGLSFCEWALILTIILTAAYWLYKKIYKDMEI